MMYGLVSWEDVGYCNAHSYSSTVDKCGDIVVAEFISVKWWFQAVGVSD